MDDLIEQAARLMQLEDIAGFACWHDLSPYSNPYPVPDLEDDIPLFI